MIGPEGEAIEEDWERDSVENTTPVVELQALDRVSQE